VKEQYADEFTAEGFEKPDLFFFVHNEMLHGHDNAIFSESLESKHLKEFIRIAPQIEIKPQKVSNIRLEDFQGKIDDLTKKLEMVQKAATEKDRQMEELRKQHAKEMQDLINEFKASSLQDKKDVDKVISQLREDHNQKAATEKDRQMEELRKQHAKEMQDYRDSISQSVQRNIPSHQQPSVVVINQQCKYFSDESDEDEDRCPGITLRNTRCTHTTNCRMNHHAYI